MENYYLPGLHATGQKHVEDWLKKNSYTDIRKEPLQVKEDGFIARGKQESLLVQVRTFLHPQRPFRLNDFEHKTLISKASKLGLVAYAAYVTVDDADGLAGDIIWERLS